MNIVLSAVSIAWAVFGVAFAAFCVWLSVQIAIRRRRWARRTAVALLVVLAFYPLSEGPVALISSRLNEPEWLWIGIQIVYRPVIQAEISGPGWFYRSMLAYRTWWASLARPTP